MIGLLGLGYDHNAAGFLVQTMNNPIALRGSNRAKLIRAMVHEGMDQSIRRSPIAWMSHHSRILVYYDYVIIFMKNLQG